MMTREELEHAYLDSVYSVLYNGREYEVIIGECSERLMDALFENTNIQSGIILTAWNPESQICSVIENKITNAKLSDDLISHDFTYYDAIGRARNSSWQEESFFIIDVSKQQAECLAVKYQQNAYIWIEQNKPAELIFSSLWDHGNN